MRWATAPNGNASADGSPLARMPAPPGGTGALEALVAEAGLADAGRAVDAEALAAGIGERALEAVQLVAATDQRPPSRHGHTAAELRQAEQVPGIHRTVHCSEVPTPAIR